MGERGEQGDLREVDIGPDRDTVAMGDSQIGEYDRPPPTARIDLAECQIVGSQRRRGAVWDRRRQVGQGGRDRERGIDVGAC
jgi:hypothetical protein